MSARYYPEHGPELIVELWEEGKGFANVDSSFSQDQRRMYAHSRPRRFATHYHRPYPFTHGDQKANAR